MPMQTTVRLEKVMLPGDKISQIWLGFIALGWPCNIKDVGYGFHTIEVSIPPGAANPQATKLLHILEGAHE